MKRFLIDHTSCRKNIFCLFIFRNRCKTCQQLPFLRKNIYAFRNRPRRKTKSVSMNFHFYSARMTIFPAKTKKNFRWEQKRSLSTQEWGKLFASGKLFSLFSRIFIVDEAKKASVVYYLGEKYFEQKMSGAPFYKKPAQAKQNFEWPPKRVVAPVKVSRQEPAEAQERIVDNREFTSNLRQIFNRWRREAALKMPGWN